MGNQRSVYGNVLVELGRENKNIVALEADLGKSTMSCLFKEQFPERYFEMGIAEANMASFAAGLSLTGKIPFIHSFAMFVTGRCYEQIRQSICLGKFNVKIIGSSYGLSDFGDGATHQAVEDISLMLGLPNMTVLTPVDASETEFAVKQATQIKGPVYLRLNRNEMPDINPEFRLGKPYIVHKGSDAVVFAHGIMVSRALKAARKLSNEGISVQVVNMSTLKPVDRKAITACAKGMKCIVSAEEHLTFGALSCIITEVFRSSGIPIEVIGIEDKFGQSANSYEELLEHYGLTADHVIKAIKANVN